MLQELKPLVEFVSPIVLKLEGPPRKRKFAHDQQEPSPVTVVLDLDFDKFMNDKVSNLSSLFSLR